MTFRVTYSVLDADMTELHREFDAAVAAVRARLGATYPSWVAGRPLESGDLLDSRTPIDTRVVLARFHRAPPASVAAAVESARAAQRGWAALPFHERTARIRRAAELLSARRLELAAIMSLEVGKNRLESLGDVEEAADLLRYYAGLVEEANGFSRPLGRLAQNEHTRDVLRPYGVFAVVSPFNFPMALPAGMAGAALLAGNAVLLKPSEETPWCAHGLYEALRDAGLPDGLFQVLHGEGETIGAALARHPGIDGVAFTGSSRVGMELHRIMSQGRVRPCLLEMGGKNAAIVCEAADLDAAVEGCARSAFGLSGQKCSALSRVYVARGRHADFLAKLAARAGKMTIDDPTRAGVDMGPVINAEAVARYERASAEARADGAVHVGGERLRGAAFDHGHFVAPTIASVPRGHRLARDELFLPFVLVEAVDGLDEAIRLANDAAYGLTAGIFSERREDIDAFMDRIEAGVLYANRRTGATTGAWPGVQSFCGWKGSGSTGKGGCGPFYVAQFAREQSQTRMGDA
ncbi:MAG TPA: aldehyde dehydrogenase family protein [Haliangiales bacterium]|nr:aldehyde dehydrogenase family protein [Haliangiales bacterium]